MKAGINGTGGAPWHTYEQFDWGDVISGTKAQLQALGLGVGLAFPREPGGPKRVLRVSDHRGFKVGIEATVFHGPAPFFAAVHFPWGHDLDSERLEPFCPGVQRRERTWHDEYLGAAPDLVAAGLIGAGQFPGMPGMRKTRVTVLADGTLPAGAPTARCARAAEPGARTVEKASRQSYRVSVNISDAEHQRRRAARAAALSNWKRKISALPRPAMLAPGMSTAIAPASPRAAQAANLGKPPLFGNPPMPKDAQAYAKHVFDSLRDLVDFSQTSAY